MANWRRPPANWAYRSWRRPNAVTSSAGTADRRLTTLRLLLRPPLASDADVILRLHQDPQAIAHNPSDRLDDPAEAQELLDRWIEHWRRHAIGYWVVCWRDDPGILGVCGVKVMTLHTRPVSNLFYRFAPQHWGRGIASEAATAVVERARSDPSRPVIARVRPDNTASARVAVKAGLRRAAHLDTVGEDGTDHIYVSPEWSHQDL
jgi:[ribosomal protein S5]-alanine N-acetyltransferase